MRVPRVFTAVLGLTVLTAFSDLSAQTCTDYVREATASSIQSWARSPGYSFRLKILDAPGLDHDRWSFAFTGWIQQTDLNGTEISSGSADITAVSLYYGMTGWAGLAKHTSGSSGAVNQAEVRYNLSSGTSPNLGLYVVFHEFGHVFTLGHVVPWGEGTVMQTLECAACVNPSTGQNECLPPIDRYSWGNRSCSLWGCPSPADIAAVNERRLQGRLP